MRRAASVSEPPLDTVEVRSASLVRCVVQLRRCPLGMDGLRLIGSSLLELDRRNAIQRFDLDAILACDGVQLYLRKQGHFSARTTAIRLDALTLSATVRHSARQAPCRLSIDLIAAGILDKDLGIVGVPQDFDDAGCQTTLPLGRRSVTKGRVPPDLLIDLDHDEIERLPMWRAANTSEQLACVAAQDRTDAAVSATSV